MDATWMNDDVSTIMQGTELNLKQLDWKETYREDDTGIFVLRARTPIGSYDITSSMTVNGREFPATLETPWNADKVECRNVDVAKGMAMNDIAARLGQMIEGKVEAVGSPERSDIEDLAWKGSDGGMDGSAGIRAWTRVGCYVITAMARMEWEKESRFSLTPPKGIDMESSEHGSVDAAKAVAEKMHRELVSDLAQGRLAFGVNAAEA
jgi:hypothetical protein